MELFSWTMPKITINGCQKNHLQMVGLWYWVSHMHLFFWILLDVQQCVYQTKTPVWIRWWMVVPPKQPTTKNQNHPLLSIRQLYLHIRKPKKSDVLNMNWISSTRVAPTHDRCMGSHLWRGFWQFWFLIEPSGVLEAIFLILKIIFLVI